MLVEVFVDDDLGPLACHLFVTNGCAVSARRYLCPLPSLGTVF